MRHNLSVGAFVGLTALACSGCSKSQTGTVITDHHWKSAAPEDLPYAGKSMR